MRATSSLRNKQSSKEMSYAVLLLLCAFSSAVGQPTELPKTANTCVIKLIGAPVSKAGGKANSTALFSTVSIKCTGEKLPVSIRVHPSILAANAETKGVTLIEDAEARGYLYFKGIRSLTVTDSIFQGLVGPILAPIVWDTSAGLFYNCQFIGNSQARAGGIYSAGRSLLHVYDSVFKGNTGSSYGAVSTTSGCRTVFINTQFLNNVGGVSTTVIGGFVSGAVFSFQNTLTEFEKCKFKQNTASGAGAGAFTGVKRTVVKFTDCIIDGNSGTSGALSLMDTSTGTMNGSQFLNNRASGEGASIELTLGSTLDVADSTCDANKGASGVIIAHDGSGISAKNSKFANNAGSFYGGAISTVNGGKTAIESCTFDSNSGPFGGAIYQDRAQELKVSDSQFMSNTAQFSGGAVFQKDVIGTDLIDSKFQKNEGGSIGGALCQTGCGEIEWLSENQQSMVRCTEGKTASCENVMIKGCSFVDNSATLQGGALFNVRCVSISVISTELPSEKESVVQERCSTRKFEGNTGADSKTAVVLRQCPATKSTPSGRKLLTPLVRY